MHEHESWNICKRWILIEMRKYYSLRDNIQCDMCCEIPRSRYRCTWWSARVYKRRLMVLDSQNILKLGEPHSKQRCVSSYYSYFSSAWWILLEDSSNVRRRTVHLTKSVSCNKFNVSEHRVTLYQHAQVQKLQILQILQIATINHSPKRI